MRRSTSGGWGMFGLYLVCGLALMSGCSDDAGQSDSGGATELLGVATIKGLPDPCEWLGAAEAQSLLGLSEPPNQTPMGTFDGAGRSCVYTNADQSRWINVGYQGLNPQVLNPVGKSDDELVELALTVYAYGLNLVDTSKTAGRSTLTFGDAERTTLIVFSGVGKARDLPEGISQRHAISSYVQPLLTIFYPQLSPDQRAQALKGLADRPVSQLLQAAGS